MKSNPETVARLLSLLGFTLGISWLAVHAPLASGQALSRQDMSAQSLARHPTCVLYDGENGLRAHIQGAVVRGADEVPEVGARQDVVSNAGHRYRVRTDDAGYYILDVPAVAARAYFYEGDVLDRFGRHVPSTHAHIACTSARVSVGPITEHGA